MSGRFVLPALLIITAIFSSTNRWQSATWAEEGAAEEETASIESNFLTNVRQVTSGMIKAGEGYFSPDGTQIAFQSNRTGNRDIYLMNADGSNQIQLTRNRADDRWPSWSPVW